MSDNFESNSYNFGSSVQSNESSSFQKSNHGPKNPEFEEIRNMLSEISSGLRILEDRYYNLRKKTQLTDQTLLDAQREFFKEKRVTGEELVESKLKIQELNEQIELMKNELDDSARQKDLIVLEKYLDYWEPINFLTRKQAEELIEDKLEESDLKNSKSD